jgi:hypothetical protein
MSTVAAPKPLSDCQKRDVDHGARQHGDGTGQNGGDQDPAALKGLESEQWGVALGDGHLGDG